MQASLITALLLLWAVVIAVIDWRQRRVPNLLLLALLGLAVAWLVWCGQGLLMAAWPASLLGGAVALLVTLPGYAVKKFGAGDVKLAAVLGFVQGWPHVSWTLLLAGLLLGAASLAVVSRYGFAKARALRIPAALYLLVGFAIVLLMQLSITGSMP